MREMRYGFRQENKMGQSSLGYERALYKSGMSIRKLSKRKVAPRYQDKVTHKQETKAKVKSLRKKVTNARRQPITKFLWRGDSKTYCCTKL